MFVRLLERNRIAGSKESTLLLVAAERNMAYASNIVGLTMNWLLAVHSEPVRSER